MTCNVLLLKGTLFKSTLLNSYKENEYISLKGHKKEKRREKDRRRGRERKRVGPFREHPKEIGLIFPNDQQGGVIQGHKLKFRVW